MVEYSHLEQSHKTYWPQAISYFWMILGAFIAAFAIDIFFIPNSLIDGGTVGLAMIGGRLFGTKLTPVFLIILNLPFIYLAYKHIGKSFVIHLLIAIFSFSIFLACMPYVITVPFEGESLEVVVIGGSILGIGIGLIIRAGGC